MTAPQRHHAPRDPAKDPHVMPADKTTWLFPREGAGSRIRQLRGRRSQVRVGKYCGASRGWVSGIERDEWGGTRAEWARKLAELFDVPVEDLFDVVPRPRAPRTANSVHTAHRNEVAS